MKRALLGSAGALSSLGLLGWMAATGSCSTTNPPRDEVVVVIDTDAPVPSWVDRLHVEVFDAAGTTLLDSHDYAMPDPADWPLSFGVHPASAREAIDVRLRVRAYNSSRPSSAFAELFVDAGTYSAPTPDTADPVSTIDRAVRITTTAGAGLVQVPVTLHGDCFGVPANVASATTCIDAPGQTVTVTPAATAPFSPTLPASVAGSWTSARSVPCATTARTESGDFDEELCIPGGVFIMGDIREDHTVPDSANLLEVPERIVQVSPFLLDRYEVSVGRFRAAMNAPVHPFIPPTEPPQPDAPIDCTATVNLRFCTWRGATASPDPAADALPVNCLDVDTARAFCQWAGGDLPSEAQWEYAATQAFRDVKTFLPWGSGGLTCDVASYGRWSVEEDTGECGHDQICGPLPVNAPFGGGPAAADCTGFACVRDETPGPPGHGGIVGMGGNVAEWVRDANDGFDAPCWQGAPRLDPVCVDPSATTNMFRGGMWMTAAFLVFSELRTGGITENPILAVFGGVGFRCVRPGTGVTP